MEIIARRKTDSRHIKLSSYVRRFSHAFLRLTRDCNDKRARKAAGIFLHTPTIDYTKTPANAPESNPSHVESATGISSSATERWLYAHTLSLRLTSYAPKKGLVRRVRRVRQPAVLRKTSYGIRRVRLIRIASNAAGMPPAPLTFYENKH